MKDNLLIPFDFKEEALIKSPQTEEIPSRGKEEKIADWQAKIIELARIIKQEGRENGQKRIVIKQIYFYTAEEKDRFFEHLQGRRVQKDATEREETPEDFAAREKRRQQMCRQVFDYLQGHQDESQKALQEMMTAFGNSPIIELRTFPCLH